MPRAARPRRRGTVAILAAVSMAVLLGLGALAIDISYMRLAQAQAQDIADAAAVAGLWALRQSQDEAEARAAAEAVLARNVVGGKHPTLTELDVGDWDHTDRSLTTDFDTPNSVRVSIAREDGNALNLFLGRIFGWDQVDVRAGATAAARNLQVVLVFDITNSWSRPDFYNARDAALAFYDTIEGTHGPFDKVGMTVYTGRYSWEFSQLTLLDDAAAAASMRAQWAVMETASKAGNPASNRKGCNVHGGSSQDDFSSPEGGCFPNMPREYRDEPGTDHTTGLEMARLMFEDEVDETAYRALVVLTDGRPNGTRSGHGQTRIDEGYEEDRWREFQGPVPHTTSQVQSESITLTEDLWDELEVHTWVVSFDADYSFMEDMPQGDGYYVLTNDSTALVDIFETIAASLPLALVE